MKINAIASKPEDDNDMTRNNSILKPSNNMNIVKLPTLLKIERPQLDMSKVKGVPKWTHDNENESENPQGVSYLEIIFLSNFVDNLYTVESP